MVMSDFISIEYGFQLYLGVLFLSISFLTALTFFSDEIDANLKGLIFAPMVILFLAIGLLITLGAIIETKAYLLLIFVVVSFFVLKIYFMKKKKEGISRIHEEREQKIKVIKAKIESGDNDILDNLRDLVVFKIEKEIKFIGRDDVFLMFGIIYEKTKNIEELIESIGKLYDGIPKYKNTKFEEKYNRNSNRFIKKIFYDEYNIEEEESFVKSVEKNIINQIDKDSLYKDIISSYHRYDDIISENLLNKIKDKEIKSKIKSRIEEEEKCEVKLTPIKNELDEYHLKVQRMGVGYYRSYNIIYHLHEEEKELKFNTDGKEKMKFSYIYDKYIMSIYELRNFVYDFEKFENKAFTNRPCYPKKDNSETDILTSISEWSYEDYNNIVCLLEGSEILDNYKNEKILNIYKGKGFNVIYFPLKKGNKVTKTEFLEIYKIVDRLEGGTLFHSDKGERAIEIKNFYENSSTV